MRILIVAPGSRGDVEPYLALGSGLAADGHFVRLLTHVDFEPLLRPHPVEFRPLDIPVQDIAQSPEMRALLERGNFAAILSQMAKEAQRGALAMARDGLAAGQGMDLILSGIGGLFPAISLAEKLSCPLVQAYYIPFTPTGSFPSFLIPPLPFRMGGMFNRLSYQLARQMIWQAFRTADNLARKTMLGIRNAPFFGPFDSSCMRGTPVLYGYSPAVIPTPPDWGGEVHVTGYWLPDAPDGWTPTAALATFLQAGPPPIYIGFGSMSHRDAAQTTEQILDALRQSGRRAVMLSGWGGLQKSNLPATVFMVDSVPFSWLFPRMAAVVHHGGAGTTAAGFRAGVPSVIVPFFGDQPYWGRRAAELGVGPDPIPRNRLTAGRLAQAIQTAVSDPEMRRKAAELGAAIRSEDGVANAVAVIRDLDPARRQSAG